MKTSTTLALALLGGLASANAQDAIPVAKTITVGVIGAVAKPSRYTLADGAGAMDALTAAGGAIDFAALKRAWIIHHVTEGKPSNEAVNLRAVLDGKEKDKPLRNRDTLVVPEANVGQKF